MRPDRTGLRVISIGSLCSGYGGIEIGVGAAVDTETSVRWLAETDPDASGILAKHHPGVPNLGDLRTIDYRAVEPVDMLCAGFPCQPVSSAGAHAVETDSRWLWPHIRDAIRVMRPARIYLENVRNIIATRKGAVLAELLQDLRSLGYASRWCILGACAVGAPHHRHRWFLLAEYVGTPAPAAQRVVIQQCGARVNSGRIVLPTPTKSDGYGGPNGHREGGPNLRTAVATLTSGDYGRYSDAIALWEMLTDSVAPVPTEPNRNGDPRLPSVLSEWLMGLASGYLTNDLSRVPALRLAGNGVVPQQSEAAFRLLNGDECAINNANRWGETPNNDGNIGRGEGLSQSGPLI